MAGASLAPFAGRVVAVVGAVAGLFAASARGLCDLDLSLVLYTLRYGWGGLSGNLLTITKRKHEK